MRRLRFSAVRLLVAAAAALLCAGRVARAQNGISGESPYLLLPIGARSIGMGQAVVAAGIGSDALWWNPALIAHSHREVALHVAQNSSLAASEFAASIILPKSRVGAFAFSLHYVNLGAQSVTDAQDNVRGGLSFSNAIVAATFAPVLTNRLSGGITYKVFRFTANCTGDCSGVTTGTPQTSAIDAGLHYRLTEDSTLSVGIAVRNFGLNLQFNDSPQADILPRRGELGVAFSPKFAQMPKEARVLFAADVVSSLSSDTSLGYRLGGELAWMERYQARAGYVLKGPTGSGPSFGVGVSTGKLQLDLALLLSDLASAGSTPTFLSIRYAF